MNSNKIGVTTRSMSKGNGFLTSKTGGKSDERVSLTSRQSTSPMNHKPSEAASDELAVRSYKFESLPSPQTKFSSTRKSKSSAKTKSSGSGSAGSSSSSYLSAKAKKQFFCLD